MESLSQAQIRYILGFLKEVYSLQTFESFIATAFAGLRQVVPVDSVGCVEMGPEENRVWAWFDPPDVSNEKQFPIWANVCHEHPAWQRFLQNPSDNAWYKLSDFLSQAKYHRTALYNELYRGMEIEDNFGTMCILAPNSLVGFSLHRDRRTFTEQDRLVLNLLQPHLIQAWRSTKLAGETLGRVQRLEEALEGRKEGIILLGRNRKVQFLTPTAMRYITEYFGALGGDDRLPEKLDAWVAHQESLLSKGVLAAPQRPLVKGGRSGSELTITLLPGQSGLTLIMQEKVVIEDLTSLGLSRRESDVLLWLSRGKSNAEIALILDVTVSTVRKHLEHIFQKLGVENRTAAVTTAITRSGTAL